MNTFDRLKLVASIDTIRDFDESQFEKIVKDGNTAYKFYQETPYLLVIKINYSEHEVVVEFTGKVLGKDYPKLISSATIRQCFQNINASGIINLDIDAMMDADVVRCDVTKDIHVEDVPRLTRYVRNHISNYQRFICRKLPNNNLVVEKNVTTDEIKKRMTIYDKGNEMRKKANQRFVEAYGLHGAFDGVCRFEINLNSKEQIRTSLGISDTKLESVLASEANPIQDFLDVVVDATSTPNTISDRKCYYTMLVLKDCDYDLEKVEAKMRQLYPSRGSNIKAIMQPFRQMMERLNSPAESDLWEDVHRQLSR